MLRRALGLGLLGWAMLVAFACTNDFDALLHGSKTEPGTGGNAGACDGFVLDDVKLPAGFDMNLCGVPEGCGECDALTSACTFGCHLCGTTCDPFSCTESSCQAHCAPNTSCDVSCGSSSFNCDQRCDGCDGTLRCAANSGNCANHCDNGASCNVECTGNGSCDLTCSKSQCTQNCQDGSCDINCKDGSVCTVACGAAAKCDFACDAGAKCIFDCAGQPNDCSFTCAGGKVISCANGRKVCGYDACPP